jgi:ParB-like chromosome segregation protein Spo0J
MNNFEPQIQWLNPESLTPYANNTKKHPVDQIDRIAQQIAKVGFDVPIVVDKNKVIIKGHGRREAALRLGLKSIPVIVRDDLDEYAVMASRIADNKVAESDWDDEKLKFEFGTLQSHDYDLTDTGFDLKEIEKILSENDITTEEIEEETIEETAATQYIVAIECKDETEMKQIYDEMTARGLECKLIT